MSLLKSLTMFLIIGLIPIFVIYWVAVFFPQMGVLDILLPPALKVSRVYSEVYPTASTLTSAWVMTGPVFGVMAIALSFNHEKIKLKSDVTNRKILVGISMVLFLIAMEIYIGYFGTQNLTDSWSFLKIISGNSTLLFFYFIVSFIAYYGMGLIPALYVSAVINTLRMKHGH